MNEPTLLNDRHEPVDPVFTDSPSIEGDLHTRSPFDRRPAPRAAGTALRISAALAFTVYATFHLAVAFGNHLSAAELIGRLIGLSFWPLAAVALAAVWDSNRTERTMVKIFLGASLLCAVVTATSFASARGYGWVLAASRPSGLTPTDARELAVRCMGARDLACAKENWEEYLRLRPSDGRAVANLGMVMNMRDEHDQAAIQFQQAIDAGEGTYDLFAYYADSLAKLNRVDEAIDWSYRALSVVPTLVDVRGSLATLLVGQHRPHEALALLQAFDVDAEARGRPAHFAGQRIAIEKIAQDTRASTAANATPLRLPAYAGHYFAPVKLGKTRPTAFMVDTGASRTTLSRAMLEASQAPYRVMDANVQMTTADGRKVRAEAIVVDALQLGPFELRQVNAIVCDGCVSLLGQSTLMHFDLQSSRVQGVEFISLSPRPGATTAKAS